MARAPRASVSQTSGQGVSRYAYQKGYRMRNPGGAGIKGPGKTDTSSSRSYAKSGAEKVPTAEGINVSYGDTLFPTDLEDVQGAYADKPQKSSVSLGKGRARKLK